MQRAIRDLAVISEERGKESAGLAVRSGGEISVFKRPLAAHAMTRQADYRDFVEPLLRNAFAGARANGAFAAIGHARLMTNGRQGIKENNQPVVKDGAVGIHNGIVVNDAALWQRYGDIHRQADVDTELLMALLARGKRKTGSIEAAAREVYREIYGTASVAVFFDDEDRLLLATNTGSLYVASSKNGDMLIFASERHFLETFIAGSALVRDRFDARTVERVAAGSGILVDLDTLDRHPFTLKETGEPMPLPAESATATGTRKAPRVRVRDLDSESEARRTNLRRCSRCILPETMPMIRFDSDGVCNFCHDYDRMKQYGSEELEKLVAPHRSRNGEPDCVVGLSGGRDSCYALHYLKEELGLNPVAYTYDWALVTDLGRRNQARMCGKLGVEHVIVAADIKEKRQNIRQNVDAWLHRPRLGMVPLFMAGDKFYFYYLQQTRQRYNVDLAFIGGNRLEKTNFKTGFCGVSNEGGWRLYGVHWTKKAQLAFYYLKEILANPRYINRSLLDTVNAFRVSYLMPHDFVWLYDYIPWDETLIDRTLRDVYDWEIAGDTDNTWRIGDGTASFYNYIYYTVVGFSEHDTFRSNQIREGMIGREEALRAVEVDNQPRYDSIEEYAHLIGFDFDEAMSVINSIPKAY
ncbi:hypothetical protein [Oceanibacterium hippocampi]|nr:hypothetical protein [Oceanibacterium hippocampi]